MIGQSQDHVEQDDSGHMTRILRERNERGRGLPRKKAHDDTTTIAPLGSVIETTNSTNTKMMITRSQRRREIGNVCASQIQSYSTYRKYVAVKIVISRYVTDC